MCFPCATGKTIVSITLCLCSNVSFFLRFIFAIIMIGQIRMDRKQIGREIRGRIGKGPRVWIQTWDSRSATVLYVSTLPTQLSVLTGNEFLVLVSLPIMVYQHVNNILEEVWLFWAEEASCDLVNGLLQLWNMIVVLLGCIVSARRKEVMSYTVHTLCECLLFL